MAKLNRTEVWTFRSSQRRGWSEAHNSVRYKADGGKYYDKCSDSARGLMEEGEINSDWGWAGEDYIKDVAVTSKGDK